MKSRPEWSKLSSAQLSTATPWAGRPYQLFEVERKERRDARALIVAEVVTADLLVVVRQAVRKRLRLRQQQQPGVLVGVAGEQHDFRRLKVLDAVGDVVDAGHAAAAVDFDRRHVRARDDLQVAGRLRAGNRRDRGRILGVHVAAAAIAEAVVHAGRPVLVRARVDGGGTGERQTTRSCGRPTPSSRGTHCRAAAASDTARLRGPSNGLPRGSILPLMFPAWPETPTSYSILS